MSPACRVTLPFRTLLTSNEGALDSGAHGILVPLLYTADDAKKLVQTAKFPPVGQRGYGSPFSMGAFGAPGQHPSGLEYLQQANDSLVTIVQIETKEALENVSLLSALESKYSSIDRCRLAG